MVARILPEFRRLYPGLSGEWHPVVVEEDLGLFLELGNGRRQFISRAHLEVKK